MTQIEFLLGSSFVMFNSVEEKLKQEMYELI